MIEVIVKKSKWCRGGMNGPSRLLNEKGFMCCLGFWAKKKRFKKKDILLKVSPYYIDGLTEEKSDGLIDNELNSPLCNDLMNINDGWHLSDDERIKAIKKLGLKTGIKFTFVE